VENHYSFCDRADPKILKYMIDSNAEFLMEVTDRTKSDVKVGSVCSVACPC
jgi:UDP-N-acetylglucosamine pyrophosphorylase